MSVFGLGQSETKYFGHGRRHVVGNSFIPLTWPQPKWYLVEKTVDHDSVLVGVVYSFSGLFGVLLVLLLECINLCMS